MAERNPVRDAVRYALTAGVAASFVGVPLAAHAEDDVAVQEKVTVTGSRIKRVDIEGPSPITVISREDIDATGDISVSDVLRGTTFNSFGSFKSSSGSSAQSQATVSLRGLGAEKTLVLIDGRRVAGSPTFGAGSAANLNTLPLAAVERIEVLRDGASAIYGSDAIGGVVNVILRKDYEGVHLSATEGRPTQDGGDEHSYSVVGGISSGKGNVTFGFNAEKREMILNGDRDFSAVGLSAFGSPGSYFAYAPPGQFGNAGTATVSLGTFPDARCPASLGSDPNFPDSTLDASGTLCQFNYAATSANEAINDTKSVFVNTNYEITDTTQFFARGTFSTGESFGRYAPTPVTPPLFAMEADNPFNPTIGQPIVDAGGNTVTTGMPITFLYRTVPGGFRDTFIEDSLVDYVAGLSGTVDWLGGSDWELAAQYSKQSSNSRSPGLIIKPFLQQALDIGTGLTAAEATAAGAWNPFGIGIPPNDPTQAQIEKDATLDGTYDAQTKLVSFDGQISFDAWQMPAGPAAIAVGFNYVDIEFEQEYDAQQNAGAVAGSAGGQDITGARAVKSLFAELEVPIFDTFTANLAGRYDDYNDFGTTFTPKIGLSFRPIDSLLLRGSWGEGFRAPSMSQLYSSPSQSFDNSIDSVRCAATPEDADGDGRAEGTVTAPHPCLSTQYENLTGGNTALDAETSTTWSAGIVFSPLDDLTLSVDYYNVEIEEEIDSLSLQATFDNELRGTDTTSVTRVGRPPNFPLINLVNKNLAKVETDGVDFEVAYAFSAGAVGDFRTQLLWTHVLDFQRDENDGNGLRDAQNTFDPDDRASLVMAWSRGDFGASVVGTYIAESDNPACGPCELDSWTTFDVSLSYATPWRGTITLGARNLFDEDPPTNPDLGNPYYSNYLHDVWGRVPFLRYEQDL
jgi:iron complex outermembrane receptor protein